MNDYRTMISARYFYRFARNAICSFLLVSFGSGIQAQSAVGAAGGDGTGSGGSTSFSIGQVAYTHFNDEGGSISLGVQQPYVILTVGVHELDITLTASVFPNPTQSTASLQLEGDHSTSVDKGLNYNLFDLNGQMVSKGPIVSSLTSIDMSTLTNGAYILVVQRESTVLKSFKIFKTN